MRRQVNEHESLDTRLCHEYTETSRAGSRGARHGTKSVQPMIRRTSLAMSSSSSARLRRTIRHPMRGSTVWDEVVWASSLARALPCLCTDLWHRTDPTAERVCRIRQRDEDLAHRSDLSLLDTRQAATTRGRATSRAPHHSAGHSRRGAAEARCRKRAALHGTSALRPALRSPIQPDSRLLPTTTTVARHAARRGRQRPHRESRLPLATKVRTP